VTEEALSAVDIPSWRTLALIYAPEELGERRSFPLSLIRDCVRAFAHGCRRNVALHGSPSFSYLLSPPLTEICTRHSLYCRISKFALNTTGCHKIASQIRNHSLLQQQRHTTSAHNATSRTMESSTSTTGVAEPLVTCSVCLEDTPRNETTVISGDAACHSCLIDKFQDALKTEARWPVPWGNQILEPKNFYREGWVPT